MYKHLLHNGILFILNEHYNKLFQSHIYKRFHLKLKEKITTVKHNSIFVVFL